MKLLLIPFMFLFSKILRRLLYASVILLAILYFSAPYLLSYYLSKITETKISNSFSYSKLFNGAIEFEKFIVYSPKEFGSKKAIEFENLIINFDLLSIPSSTKIIKFISSEKVNINSINKENKNNITTIVNNIKKYFETKNNRDDKTGDYLIREINLNNIFLTVYNKENRISSTKINDIKSFNYISSNLTLAFLKSTILELHDKTKLNSDKITNNIWNIFF